MAHQPDYVRRWLRQLGEPPASHPRVELQVHRHVVRDLTADGDDEFKPRLVRLGELVGRAHDDDPRIGKLAAQLHGFGDSDDAEGRSPGLERRPSDVTRAVAVAVCLHDGPELGTVERLEQPPRVVANRAEVDRDLAPVHASSLARERAAGLRSSRLLRGHSAATLRARRVAALRRLPRLRAAAPCLSRGTRP